MDIKKIRLLATDVDGTLTDGAMYYSSTGETSKRFYVRDGLGVQLAQCAHISVAFISSDSSPVIANRAQRLGVDYCFSGVDDKVAVVRNLCDKMNIALSQVAFLGDDLQDLEVMRQVGLAAAVGDAHLLLQKEAFFVCQKNGGFGAFREFAEWLIVQQEFDLSRIWMKHMENKKTEGGAVS